MEKRKEDLAAAQVYYDLCKMLDGEGWKYKKNVEELRIECGARGEDLPIELNIKVDAERQLVMVLSHLPYRIPEDKRIDIAIAVSVVNNRLVDGCVDYDITTGNLFFRMTNSYMDSTIGGEVYKYLLYCACQTIDSFNDRLLMLSKGMIDIAKFIELCEKE